MDKMIFNSRPHWFLGEYYEDIHTKQRRAIKFNPKYIRGYPSSIGIVAKYMLENNVSGIHPVAIITTAEKLNLKDKVIIMDAFDCEIFDHCGCGDGKGNFCECEAHSSYWDGEIYS